MALMHSCPNAGTSGSPKCRPNQPGRGPVRCPGCGATPEVEAGSWGVFPFDPQNRDYTREALGTLENQRTFQRRDAADRLADRLTEAEAAHLRRHGRPPGWGYVVRWIHDRWLCVAVED